MTAAQLQVTSDLAQAAVLLHRHGIISVDQGLALCRGVFDAEPSEASYRPIFYVLLDSREFWSVIGWDGETLDCGPENGAEVIEFVKKRPKYNAIQALDKERGWCICCRRGLSEAPFPRLAKGAEKSTPKPDTPPESTENAKASPMKRGPGRPKSKPEGGSESPDQAKEPARKVDPVETPPDDGIPF